MPPLEWIPANPPPDRGGVHSGRGGRYCPALLGALSRRDVDQGSDRCVPGRRCSVPSARSPSWARRRRSRSAPRRLLRRRRPSLAVNGAPCGDTPPPTTTSGPTTVTTAPTTSTSTPPPGGAPALHVSGNRLADTAGTPVTLRGVNRSGGEFGCVQGTGIFDGPMDAASVAAIKSRHANVVRVPFNEDCWLGLPNVKPEYAGATYRAALKSYVDLLHQNGLVAILDLHRPATWSPRGTRTTSTRAARRRAGTAGSRRSPRRCRWWPGRSARTTARAATSPA